MIFGKLKNYLLLILSGLLAILAFLLKIFGSRSKRLKIESEFLKARVHRDAEIMNRENELEKQSQSRRAQAARDDSIARTPGRLWKDDTDDT